MDFSSSSVVYIIIIIIIVCIFYICYIMYNDISALKIKVDALHSNIASLTLAQNSVNYASRKKESSGSDSGSDDGSEDDTEGDTEDDSDSDDTEGDGGDIVERHSNNKGEWLQHSIYDQFLIDPSQLHHLQQLQQEIQGDRLETIHELDEESGADTEGVEGVSIDNNPKGNEVNEIKFISDTQKKYCPKVLKSGKNKGLSCGKEANPESGFCKIHSNSE
jgi:hypothetical protein